MPCLVQAPQPHRPKRSSPCNHYGALIARKEMLANSDAYQALKDEAKKLTNPRTPVWLVDNVCYWKDVKERARKSNFKLHRFRLFGFVVQTGSELARS